MSSVPSSEPVSAPDMFGTTPEQSQWIATAEALRVKYFLPQGARQLPEVSGPGDLFGWYRNGAPIAPEDVSFIKAHKAYPRVEGQRINPCTSNRIFPPMMCLEAELNELEGEASAVASDVGAVLN